MLFSFLASSMVYAQGGKAGSITGKITDGVTGDELIGASVAIEGTSFGVASNLTGEYIIHNVQPGTYTLNFRYLGYQDLDMPNIKVEQGQTLELNVQMSPMSETLGEVIITAQARGQMAAINQERASTGITNVVSADKIKEVPDVNAAESIGRLPGVSLQRSGGEGNKVVVRGLSPKYTIVEVDGVRLSGVDLDRSVGLSTISSEMLDGIELSKSLTADKDADAVGGIINLRTAVAGEGFHFNAMARGGYNNLNSDFGDYKFAAGISNRFIDNKLGIILNISNERVNRSSQKFNTSYGNAANFINDASTPDNPNDSILPIFPTTTNIEIQKSIRHRTNGNLAFDFKNDFMKLKFNNIYSRMTMENELRNSVFRFNNGQFGIVTNETKPLEQIQTHTVNSIFNFLTTELSVNYSYSRTSMENTVDNYDFTDKEALAVNPDDPNGERYQSIPETQLYFKQPKDVIAKYYELGYIGKPVLNDNRRDTIDRLDVTNVVNLDWKIPFALGNSVTGHIKTGVKYSHKRRKSDKNRIRSRLGYGGIGEQRKQVFYAANPEVTTWLEWGEANEITGLVGENFLIEDYDWGEILKGEYELGLAPDLEYLQQTHNNLYNYDTDIDLYEPDGLASYEDDFEVTEELKAAYIMAEINIGKRLTLMPGVRFEQMNTSYQSYSIQLNEFDPTGINIGYPDTITVSDRVNKHLFPSVNIKYEATKWIDIRAGYFKSAARPNFLQLSPLIIASLDYTDITAYNPYLNPSLADNFDVGVSFFTNKFGLFSINYFHKEITGIPEGLGFYRAKWYKTMFEAGDAEGQWPQEIIDQLGYPIESGLWPDNFIQSDNDLHDPELKKYTVNNPNKGVVDGIEISWQTNFWYLPGMLSGLVLDINYTHIISNYDKPYIAYNTIIGPPPLYREIKVPVYDIDERVMPDQPSDIINVRVGWDYLGFSSRVSLRYETENAKGLDVLRDVKNEYKMQSFRADLNLKYNITEQLSVSGDFMNITSLIDNNVYRAMNQRVGGYVDYDKNLEHYGFTAQFGIKYDF